MRAALLFMSLGLAVGCADSGGGDGRDFASDDVVDPDAKADAARPLGLYKLIDPNSFDEGWPRMEFLDLRRDDTFYTYEIGPVDNNGNFEEGYNSYFGTFTLTKAASTNIACTAALASEGGYWYTFCASNAANAVREL